MKVWVVGLKLPPHRELRSSLVTSVGELLPAQEVLAVEVEREYWGAFILIIRNISPFIPAGGSIVGFEQPARQSFQSGHVNVTAVDVASHVMRPQGRAFRA